MFYQLIINTLTGAGTGYVTNNIAIKMLFKKYFGRFGGMIEDTREEFVQNISQLIEKDLINHHTLQDEFQSQKFHNYIKELVKDMFTDSLLKNAINLKDIKGVHETTDNGVKFLENNRSHRLNVKNKLAAKPFKNAVSRLQILHFSKHVVDVLHKDKTAYIQEATAPLKKFKINDLIREETLLKLTNNIENILHGLDLSSFDDAIDETIEKLLGAVNVDKTLEVAKFEAQNLYLKQIFSDKENASRNIVEKLIEISLSDDGKRAIENSVVSILETLKDVDVSLLSLLDDNVKESIKSFMKSELPNIVKKIIEFMDQNEKDLENLINDSINEALSDGVFADIKKKIVNVFYTNIVADFKVIGRMKEFMLQYQDRAEEEITAQIIDILENKSIGEIYETISKKNIVTPQKVITLVINNIKKFKTNKNFHLIDVALQKQVKDYSTVDLSFVKKRLIPHSIHKLKTEFIYSDKLKNLIFKETTNLVDEFKIKTIEEALGKKLTLIADKIASLVDKDALLGAILQNANKILDKPIKEVVNVGDVKIDYQRHIQEIVEKRSMKEIISYMQSEEVYVAVESALIKVIVDNLEGILRGNVSEAVKKELSKLPPAQIKDMVEEFMGEELKPINYFGAALGGVAGAGVGAMSIPVWANPFIYGIVGVATNYLAIKMLFQPYTPLKIGKFKIPLSEGVLPSNKDKMATKMSVFVDEFMINGTSIQEFFKHNGDNLKTFIKSHIARDDYAVIDKLVHQSANAKDVSNEAVTLIFSFLDANQDLIADKIFNISMSYYDKRDEYAEKSAEFIYDEVMKREFKEFMYEGFEKFVNKDQSLVFLAEDLFRFMDVFMEKTFDSAIEIFYDSKKTREIIVGFESYFDGFVSERTLARTIDESAKIEVGKKLNESLLELFYSKETVNELLSFFTKGEFGAQSKLSDMINGMLPKIIEKNLKLIINESVVPAMKEHKKIIRAEIMKKIPFGAGWIVKNDIDKTINIILDKEVPSFIDAKAKQINAIVQDVLDTQLLQLGYTKDSINQKKVDDLIRSIFANKNFSKSFAKSMDVFMNAIFEMKLKTLLKLFGISTLAELYDLFEPNINRVTRTMHKSVKSEKTNILAIMKNLTQDKIAVNLLETLKINDILKGFDKSVLLKEFEYLEKTLKESKKFQEATKNIINNFIRVFIKNEFLDKNVFKEDLNQFLKEIVKDKEELRSILTPFFKEFLLNLNEILDLKLKDHMLDIVVNAAFASMEAKITQLMGAVDFKKVITKEIQAMHPKELEDMFYSFAGPYFNKLIMYGSIGFFFGILTLFHV